MTAPAPAPAKRSKKLYVLWAIALTLLISTGLFCWLVVVPVWQVRRVVVQMDSASFTGDMAIAALGGESKAMRPLVMYSRLPAWAVRDRETAVRLLSGCGKPAVPHLLRLLQEKSLRIAAADALAELGHCHAVDAFPDILRFFRTSRDLFAARSLAYALVKTCPDVTKHSAVGLEILCSEWPEVRHRAVWFFMDATPPSASALKRLTKCLDSEEADIRVYAATILGYGGADARGSVNRLCDLLLTDRVPEVRLAAARSLGMIKVNSQRVREALYAAVIDKMMYVRVNAMWAITQLGTRKRSESTVRVSCVSETGRYYVQNTATSPWAIPAGTSTQMDMMSVYADGNVPTELRKRLEDMASGNATTEALSDLSLNAVAVLGHFGPKSAEAVPTLLKVLADKDRAHHAGDVAWALGEIGDSRAIAPLQAMTRSEHWFARENAAQALGKFGLRARQAVPDLKKLLGDESEHVRQAAAEALKKIKAAGEKK
jgi:HEAT repeat protein